MTGDKRAAILQATLKLISVNGFHGTAMSKVAQEAGVSAGIIYHYFDSKEDLIDQLYLQVKYDLSQALLAGYSEGISIRERFGRVWTNTLRFHLDHPKETAFLEQYENSPFVKPVVQERAMEYYAPLVQFLQQAMQDGILQVMPNPMFYALTIEVAISLAKKQHAGTLVLDDDLIAIAIDACWNAVSSP
jgi:AcrR family transcriptional regulator